MIEEKGGRAHERDRRKASDDTSGHTQEIRCMQSTRNQSEKQCQNQGSRKELSLRKLTDMMQTSNMKVRSSLGAHAEEHCMQATSKEEGTTFENTQQQWTVEQAHTHANKRTLARADKYTRTHRNTHTRARPRTYTNTRRSQTTTKWKRACACTKKSDRLCVKLEQEEGRSSNATRSEGLVKQLEKFTNVEVQSHTKERQRVCT